MEEKNTKNQLLVESAKAMWNEYFTNFDPALIEVFVRQLPKFSDPPPAPWSILGSGADCIAYGRRISGMEYCVTVPKREFRERLDADNCAWLNDISRMVSGARRMLFAENIPLLIPPMQVLDNATAIVMPAGKASGSSLGNKEADVGLGEDLLDLTNQTYACLEKFGLELNDAPQISWWRGVPFIHDWSDLRRK